MALETYTLDEADLNAIMVAVQAYNPLIDPEAYEGSVSIESLEKLGLMFEVATAGTVTYEGPDHTPVEDDEPRCENCNAVLPTIPFSSYACSEPCEEAILEHKHEAEEAGTET